MYPPLAPLIALNRSPVWDIDFRLPFKNSLFLKNVTAIIDRLVHHSYVIKITGKSYRIKDLLPDDISTSEED